MAKKTNSTRDVVVERLDRIIELLENVLMLQGRRYGLSRDQVRGIVSLDAKRVSRVTQHVTLPE
jgi:hypothetical protein